MQFRSGLFNSSWVAAVFLSGSLTVNSALCGEDNGKKPDPKDPPAAPGTAPSKEGAKDATPPPQPTAPAASKAPAQGNGAEELPELPRAKLDEGVFVQAGDVKVMNADIEKVLLLWLTEEKRKNPKNIPAADRVMRGRLEISQMLMQNALIEKYAADNKLEASKDEMDRYIELKKNECQAQGTTFQQMLADTGWNEAEYRRFWSAKIGIEKKAAAAVTDAEIEAFFAKNRESMPLRSAAHILFQFAGADSAPKTNKRTKEDTKLAAEDALIQLKAGKKTFAELAAKSDDESTSINGGAVEFFPIKGKDAMVDEFAKATYALEKVGDLTGVVESRYGFHIIKLTGIRDAEFKVEIRRLLATEKFNELLGPTMETAIKELKFNEALTLPPAK